MQPDISLLSDSILFYLFYLMSQHSMCTKIPEFKQPSHTGVFFISILAVSPGSFLSFSCFYIGISCSWCSNDLADGFPKKHSSPRAGSRWHVWKGFSSERAKAGFSLADTLDSYSRPICLAFLQDPRGRKRTEK